MIRSKALWAYLSSAGVLDKTKEEIQRAKEEYRRIQKREWKRKNDKVVKELRPRFTHAELEGIKLYAKPFGLTPTVYFKKLVLASLEKTHIVPEREQLLQVLRDIGLAYNKTEKYKHIAVIVAMRENLAHAELSLINYLTNHK